MNIVIEWAITFSLTYLIAMLKYNKAFMKFVWYYALNVEKEWNKLNMEKYDCMS